MRGAGQFRVDLQIMAGGAVANDMSAEKIFSILKEISSAHPDLGITIDETVKGAITMGGSTGAGAMVGGLLGGPVGMFAGSAVGYALGSLAAANNVKSFKPLWKVLSDMSQEEETKLVAIAKRVILREGIILAGNYGSQVAKNFLATVYQELTGIKPISQ